MQWIFLHRTLSLSPVLSFPQRLKTNLILDRKRRDHFHRQHTISRYYCWAASWASSLYELWLYGKINCLDDHSISSDPLQRSPHSTTTITIFIDEDHSDNTFKWPFFGRMHSPFRIYYYNYYSTFIPGDRVVLRSRGRLVSWSRARANVKPSVRSPEYQLY